MLSKRLANMFLLLLVFSSGEAIHRDVLTPDPDSQSFSVLSSPLNNPSCFAEGTSWSIEEAVDVVEETPSLYSCQYLCFESPNCKMFTWYLTQASSLAFTCFLYSSPTTAYPCTNCVSGPRSCTCDLPKPQEHGDWFCPPSISPPTCHLECDPGYVSNNGTVLMCQHGEWSSTPSCVAAVALITGSWDSWGSPQNTVEVYSEGLHLRLPDLPDDREGHSLDLVDSSILLCGGDWTMTSCLMMTSSQQWVHHSTLTAEYGREDHSSVSTLGQLHLLGGGYPSTWPTTEYLTRASASWNEGWHLLEDTWGACAAKVEPELVVVSGGDSFSNDVVSYNVTSGKANRLQDLISPAKSHGCCYIKQEGFRGVLVAGGNGGAYNISQIYDFNTGEWSTTGVLTTERSMGVMLFVIGEQILASGGAFGGASVDRFNLTSRTWAAAENMLDERAYHAVTGVPPGAVGIGSH